MKHLYFPGLALLVILLGGCGEEAKPPPNPKAYALQNLNIYDLKVQVPDSTDPDASRWDITLMGAVQNNGTYDLAATELEVWYKIKMAGTNRESTEIVTLEPIAAGQLYQVNAVFDSMQAIKSMVTVYGGINYRVTIKDASLGVSAGQ